MSVSLGDTMASYSQWNKAIADFVTRDCGAGSPVYLNVTEDNLPDIAKGFDQRVDDPIGDFVAAVRSFADQGAGLASSRALMSV